MIRLKRACILISSLLMLSLDLWGIFTMSLGKDKYSRPSAAEIKKALTPLQYKVTQEKGTEPPFDNPYWDNHAEGLYVDIVSGEPLFSSLDKYDSKTGWPSFSAPLSTDYIVLKEDRSLFSRRTEVRSKYGDSHLGHVFDDGPPATGLRYCMNSAAMRFIPKERLAEEGYGEYLTLFGAEKKDGKPQEAKATFAGGCFWCMEPPFDQLPGVKATISGYMGGEEKNPTYELVASGQTGHAEAMQVTYDPQIISYDNLLQIFWRNIDPTQKDGQFCDKGRQYRSEIFAQNADQLKLAEASRQQLLQSGKFPSIATSVTDARKLTFYPAEDYHQDYYRKNPIRYKVYRFQCGRDQRLKELWSKGG